MKATITDIPKDEELEQVKELISKYGGTLVDEKSYNGIPAGKCWTDYVTVTVEFDDGDNACGFDVAVCDLGHSITWDTLEKEEKKVAEKSDKITHSKTQQILYKAVVDATAMEVHRQEILKKRKTILSTLQKVVEANRQALEASEDKDIGWMLDKLARGCFGIDVRTEQLPGILDKVYETLFEVETTNE